MPSSKQKKEEPSLVEDWVACDGCASWVRLEGFGESCTLAEITRKKLSCRNCAKLKALEAELISLKSIVAELNIKPTTWCDIAKKIPEMLNMKTDVDKLLEKAKKDDNVQSSVRGMEGGPRSVEEPIGTLTVSQLRQATDEVTEVERRKMNLVVSGFGEHGDDLEEFLLFANNMHDLSEPLLKEDITVERLGRAPGLGRPRLMKIKFSSATKRRMVLTMGMKIKDRFRAERPSIYIRPDLTKAQQQLDKALRQELLAEGKENYKIQRGKIVPRNNQLPGHVNGTGSMNHQAGGISLEEGGVAGDGQGTTMRHTAGSPSRGIPISSRGEDGGEEGRRLAGRGGTGRGGGGGVGRGGRGGSANRTWVAGGGKQRNAAQAPVIAAPIPVDASPDAPFAASDPPIAATIPTMTITTAVTPQIEAPALQAAAPHQPTSTPAPATTASTAGPAQADVPVLLAAALAPSATTPPPAAPVPAPGREDSPALPNADPTSSSTVPSNAPDAAFSMETDTLARSTAATNPIDSSSRSASPTTPSTISPRATANSGGPSSKTSGRAVAGKASGSKPSSGGTKQEMEKKSTRASGRANTAKASPKIKQGGKNSPSI